MKAFWQSIKWWWNKVVLGKEYFTSYDIERGSSSFHITKGYKDRKGIVHIEYEEEVYCGSDKI
jgi:hypothetical protein